MQGRLSQKINLPLQSFPKASWKEEFFRAYKFGYKKIEWLIDKVNDFENPIFIESERLEIQKLCDINNLMIETLCAHFILEGSIIKGEKNSYLAKDYLKRICKIAPLIGVKYISLPLMENMSLSKDIVRNKISKIIEEITKEYEVNILIESDLKSSEIFNFISSFNSNKIGILYDTGNAARMGFEFESDFPKISKQVKEIHFKDFNINLKKSVRLGDGNTNFKKICEILKTYNWEGNIILETPVYEDWGKEASHNYNFSMDLINRYYL